MSDKVQNYNCRNCGAIISPPELLLPMFCGQAKAVGKFQIDITDKCDKCGQPLYTTFRGEVLKDLRITVKVEVKK